MLKMNPNERIDIKKLWDETKKIQKKLNNKSRINRFNIPS